MIDLHDELVTALAGRYEIERELGHGGMAVVYLAHDPKNGRRVALKVLRPELANSIATERFLQEIAIAAPLVHPNIVPLHDSGEASGFLYYTMPFVEGETLRQRLERDVQLPIDEALAIARQIAAALDYAHAKGTIHRDIKPDNILLLGNHVLVADFGLARAITRSASKPLTTQGIVVGTPAYMSPEQCQPGDKVNPPTDIYSLGCVVFEMIAGVPPFRGATSDVLISHHLLTAPPSLCGERRSCPPALDAVVWRALAKAPADRYRSAGEFAAALDRAVEGATLTPAASRAGVATTATPRPLLRRKWVQAATAALLLIAVAFLINRTIGGPAIRLGERDWLLVADFEGPKEDPTVSIAVRELVTAELNQSRFLRTVTRQQLNSVMRLAGVAETTHVDAELARQLAYRSAVRAIVVGSIQRLGEGRYSVALHVVSAEDGRNVYSAATTSMEAGLVPAIGELARDVRQRLGERRKAIEATLPLLEAATPSFAAYQKYVEGLARARRGDVAAGNGLLHEALDLDPQFASAWAAIGVHFLGMRNLDSAQFAFARALQIPGRLTQAQTYRLKGDVAYSIDYDIPAAVRWYDLYLAEYPQAIGGRNNRALYVSAIGRYEDAVSDLRAAVALSPFGPANVQTTLFNLSAMLVALEHLDEAERVIGDLTPPFKAGAALLVSVARASWPQVRVIADSLTSAPKAPALLRLLGTTARASALAASGSVPSAAGVFRQARDSASGATARWYDRAELLLSIANGVTTSGMTLVSTSDSSSGQSVTIALRAAAAGDTALARRYLVRIDSANAHERALLGNGPALVRGWIAARGGRWADVTAALARPALAGEHDATLLDRVSSVEMRWLVANAYASQGKLDSAVLHMRKAVSAERVPAGHLVLRGLVMPSAQQRITTWSKQLAAARDPLAHPVASR